MCLSYSCCYPALQHVYKNTSVEKADISTDVIVLCDNMVESGLCITVKDEATESSYVPRPSPPSNAAFLPSSNDGSLPTARSDETSSGGDQGVYRMESAKERFRREKNEAMRTALRTLTENDVVGDQDVRGAGGGTDGGTEGGTNGSSNGSSNEKRPRASAKGKGKKVLYPPPS